MTTGFATKTIRLAGTAVLACILATSVEAQRPSPSATPEIRALFFDLDSAALTPEAKTIVLRAVDAAEKSGARRIDLAAHSSSDEFARDPDLAARRAAAVEGLIVDYGFRGLVIVDEEAPEIPLVRIGDATFDRSAILHVSR